MAATAPRVIERGPRRAATFGPSSVIAMNVRASGRFTIPACSGDSPRPDWSSSVSTNMKLPKKKSEAKFSSRPAENARSRKSARLSSGSPPLRVSRRSQARVAASTGSASASDTQVQTGQPSSRPSVSGTSASASPPETPTAPSGSSRGRRCPRARGTTTAATISAMTPTGTLTRKMARQPRPKTLAWISPPPRICPDTKPSPMVAP